MMEKEDRKLLKRLQGHGNISTRGALKFWCGKKLASGVNRDVYELKFDSRWVVKIQITNNFDNILEWNIWGAIQFADWWAEWFAECLCITETGMVLVQRRAEFPTKKMYPKRIPRFFTDTKYKNYGFINGHLVCVDYSNVLSMLTGFMDKKMRNAKWWTPYDSKGKIKKARGKDYVIQAKM